MKLKKYKFKSRKLHRLMALLGVYSFFMAIYLGYASQVDDNYYHVTHPFTSAPPSSAAFFNAFIFFAIIYGIRFFALFLPEFVKKAGAKFNTVKWVTGGLAGAVAPEAFLVYVVGDISINGSCSSTSLITDCNFKWSVVVYLLIASSVLQITCSYLGTLAKIPSRLRKK